MNSKELKEKAKHLKPFTSIGKNGITENTINQIKLYLKANKLCKIKLLKSFIDSQELSKKELANLLSKKTNSKIIEQVGFIIVLWKR